MRLTGTALVGSGLVGNGLASVVAAQPMLLLAQGASAPRRPSGMRTGAPTTVRPSAPQRPLQVNLGPSSDVRVGVAMNHPGPGR